MTTVNIGDPNDKQRLFFLSDKKFTAFGGARGGGKSWAVRAKAKMLCLRYAGIKVLIVRRTYPELTNNHIDPLTAELPRTVATYNKTDKIFRFFNSSSIKFSYCRNDADLGQYQGAEYDVIFIDEATQLTENQFNKIKVCCRGTNSFPKRIYLTCNPGGVGHAWVKRLFIDCRYNPEEEPEDYAFIKSLPQDNTALMSAQPDYIKSLESLPDKLRRAWLHGDWDIFEGQFFEDFVDDPKHYDDRVYTHVINPFDIPPGWSIYRSYDFGYAKPFSCAWWAVDFDGCVYRILELYGCTKDPNVGVKWLTAKQFDKIAEIENTHPWLKGKNIRGVADPAIWQQSGGESVAETAAKRGIFFDKGDHDRIPGWMQFHYRLAFDSNGFPMMYVFSNCKGFIRTIPTLVYSETDPEDLDTKGEDHIADETRYFLMSRPISPRATVEEAPPVDDPLDMIADLRKKKKSSIFKR